MSSRFIFGALGTGQDSGTSTSCIIPLNAELGSPETIRTLLLTLLPEVYDNNWDASIPFP